MIRILAMALIAGAALAQAPPEGLTARQLFYDEGKPEARLKPAEPRQAASQTGARPAAKPVVAARTKPPGKKAPVPVQAPATVEVAAANRTDKPNVPIVTVANRPVAIRYSLVKLENGGEAEVPATHHFRSGDQVRLKVEANQSGYLYLIARGSSGIWKPLFPSREASDNRVEARRGYDVPSSTQAFTFDGQAGTEKIFLVFSRAPLADLDSQIDQLRNRPASAPTGAAKAPIMLAQNLTDRRVQGMREMYSRDLIVETVDAGQAAPVRPASATDAGSRRRENAVYVASTSRAGDARVVADIELVHEEK